MDLKTKIFEDFGGRIRVRICGILIHDNKLLLIKHEGLGPDGILWAPPGGGLNFGEDIEAALIREFHEETGLEIKVQKFISIHEFISPPLHSIELFYKVETDNLNKLKLGNDPEITKYQTISDVRFFDIESINSLPKNHKHQLLQNKLSLLKLIDVNSDA